MDIFNFAPRRKPSHMVIVIMNHKYFSHIKDLSREQNIHLQPQTVFIDYEIATTTQALPFSQG
jgi:hypothetical protein